MLKNKMKSSHLTVSVILPSYNEAENIQEVIQRIASVLGEQLFEIIVVDDDSPDETGKKADGMHHPKVRVIRRIGEKGLASAIARGVRESHGDAVVWLDCDLGIPPEIIPILVEKLNTFDVVIGSRYVPGGGDPRPFLRRSLSRLLNLFARMLFGSRVSDYTSGVAAVRRAVMDKVLWKDNGFGEYFAEFSWRCIQQRLRIVEVGLTYSLRKGGVSKSDGTFFILLKYGIQYGLKMVKWRFTLR